MQEMLLIMAVIIFREFEELEIAGQKMADQFFKKFFHVSLIPAERY